MKGAGTLSAVESDGVTVEKIYCKGNKTLKMGFRSKTIDAKP